MVMTRTRLLPPLLGVMLSAVLVMGAGCNKPSEPDCRKALANMQMLLGTEQVSKNADIEGEVRRCQGGSSRTAVDCAIKASTLDELRACSFMKMPASETPTAPAEPAGSARN
jgi:hypothetical protein